MKMKFKLFFILFGIAFTASIGLTNADPSKEEHSELLGVAVKKLEDVLYYRESQLKSCRANKCGRNCRATKGDVVCERDKPLSDSECDASLCKGERSKRDKATQELKDTKSTKAKHDESEEDVTGNSSIAQVRKKKKNMDLYRAMGVGTSAFLWKLYSVNYACCGPQEPSCCSRMKMYGKLATVATGQTAIMLAKKDKLQKTEDDMCIAKGMCQEGDGLGLGEGEGVGEGEGKKVCENKGAYWKWDGKECKCPSPYKIDQAKCREKTEEEYFCPVRKELCEEVERKIEKVIETDPTKPPGLGADPGTNINPKAISEMVGHVFKPEGGWPKGLGDPFSDSGTYNYDKLPKDVKKQLDNLNKQKQDFMNKNGLGGALDSSQDSDSDNQGLLGASGTSSGSGKGVSAAFKGGEDDGSRSLSALTGNSGSRPRKSSSLAEQMQNRLKAMHGGKNKNKFGFLGDKSVKIGRDNVGVREDNIFHMVHRMNRKLEGEKRFIPTISF